MPKLLLVHPPIFLNKERSPIEAIHSVTPPLGLAYLASFIRDLPVEIEILDAQQSSLTDIESFLQRVHPDIVGVTATTACVKSAAAVCRIAKDRCSSVTVVGGPHITAAPAATLAVFPQIDVGVVGDGEETFRELTKRLLSKHDYSDLEGIVYRTKTGEVVQTRPKMGYLPLDALPFPAWDLLPPLSSYEFQPGAYQRKPHTIVIGSRGCPYNCIFCHVAKFRSKVRFRSPRNIVDEIEQLVYRHGIREVRFGDEIFTLNKKWVESVCQEIIERGLGICWSCNTRADHLTYELASKLRKAGCWLIGMGIESGSETILKSIRKHIKLDQVKESIRRAHQADLRVKGYFMIGFPFETRTDIEDTIRFAANSKLDFAQFSYVVPFPGTDLYDFCVKRGYFGEYGWLDYEASLYDSPICVPDGMTREDLRSLFRKAYRGFYLRPQYWIQLFTGTRSVCDVKRYLRGALALFKM